MLTLQVILKVMGADTDRLAMTSYLCSVVKLRADSIFEINGNICRIFPHCTFNAPADGVSLGIL